MHKIITLIFAILTYLNTIKSEQLPLSLLYNNKPIYHIKANQLDKWSCGYNFLFNAANIEQHCGRWNKNSDFNNFEYICRSYLNSIGQQSHEASSNRIIDTLAQKLGLTDHCYLHLNSYNKVEPFLNKYKGIKYYGYKTQAEIDKMLNESRIQENQNRIDEINRSLSINKGKLYFVHFCCHVEDTGGPHAILISLIQNINGKAIYIFDNLNRTINQYSQAKLFIDYIYTTFKVFLDPNRNFIDFPKYWPSYSKIR